MITGCPKAMVHGPCGGVRPDGTCEIGTSRCAFLDEGVVRPTVETAQADAGPNAAARELLAILARRPLVVAGLPADDPGPDAQRATAAAVAGHVDAALLGDEPWSRLQLPPALRAGTIAAEGVRVWAALNCRDRNRVALEGELLGLAHVGVGAVHCVTGDHPASGDRADARPVFDLDAPRLAALAAGRGLLVSVAESPAAPPQAERADRAALKAAAGAQLCFVNHAPGELVAEFVARGRALAPELRFVACVGLAVSPAGLKRLQRFAPGMAGDAVTAVEHADPVGAAVKAGVAAAQQLLALPEVDGVCLGAAAGPGEALRVAAALALAADELGGGT